MKRSRDEFIKRWKYHLSGMCLFGRMDGKIDNVLQLAAKVHDLPADVEKLLGQLWDDLKPDDKPLPVKGPK